MNETLVFFLGNGRNTIGVILPFGRTVTEELQHDEGRTVAVLRPRDFFLGGSLYEHQRLQ